MRVETKARAIIIGAILAVMALSVLLASLALT